MDYFIPVQTQFWGSFQYGIFKDAHMTLDMLIVLNSYSIQTFSAQTNLLNLKFLIPDISERDQNEISSYKVSKNHVGHNGRELCVY